MEYLGCEKEINKVNPLVSVVVLAYQHAPFISQCIEGILNQDVNFPYEIIIGEDGSTDGTREICKDFAEKYPRKIRLFLRDRKDVIYSNGNPSGKYNFIATLKSCRGKYVAHCDGDDYWTDSGKLLNQMLFLDQNTAFSLCVHRVKILENRALSNDNFSGTVFNLDYLIDHGRIGHTSSYFFRNFSNSELGKRFFEYFLRADFFGGDRLLQMVLVTIGPIKMMPEFMAIYRKHSASITGTKSFAENYNLGSFILLKKFNHITDFKYKDKVESKQKFWLTEIVKKNVQIKIKVIACKEAFLLSKAFGIKLLLIFPFYAFKALIYSYTK